MSTLTHANPDFAADLPEARPAAPVRRSFLARLYDTIVESQQRRAEREIGRYLANRGPLTDEIEREIMRRLSGARPL